MAERYEFTMHANYSVETKPTIGLSATRTSPVLPRRNEAVELRPAEVPPMPANPITYITCVGRSTWGQES